MLVIVDRAEITLQGLGCVKATTWLRSAGPLDCCDLCGDRRMIVSYCIWGATSTEPAMVFAHRLLSLQNFAWNSIGRRLRFAPSSRSGDSARSRDAIGLRVKLRCLRSSAPEWTLLGLRDEAEAAIQKKQKKKTTTYCSLLKSNTTPPTDVMQPPKVRVTNNTR